jgi:hypothetical protein
LQWGTATAASRGESVSNKDLIAEHVLSLQYAVVKYTNTLLLVYEGMKQLEKEGKEELPPILWKSPRIESRGEGKYCSAVTLPVIPQDQVLGAMSYVAEVWLDGSVEEPLSQAKELRDSYRELQAQKRQPSPSPGDFVFQHAGVACVLAAANSIGIGLIDVLHHLFVLNKVVLVKLPHLISYSYPFYQRVFATLMAKGFLQVAVGDADTGQTCVHHPLVDHIHLTGALRTHDIIVWGESEDEGQRRRREEDPCVRCPVTSELGNVTPCVLVPGDWSYDDMIYHAQNIVGSFQNNCSFNCNATKVIVTHKRWRGRAQMREAILHVLKKTPARMGYYPGARERYNKFKAAYPQGEVIESPGWKEEGVLPFFFVQDVECDLHNVDTTKEYALQVEVFAPCLIEICLDTGEEDDVTSYLREVTKFCNQRIWGNLSAWMIVDGEVEEMFERDIEKFLVEMDYGALAVNVWTGSNYCFAATFWGGSASNTKSNALSGVGFAHNALMYDHPVKSVVRCPFIPLLRRQHSWFAMHRNSAALCRAMTTFEYNPSYWNEMVYLNASLWQ